MIIFHVEHHHCWPWSFPCASERKHHWTASRAMKWMEKQIELESKNRKSIGIVYYLLLQCIAADQQSRNFHEWPKTWCYTCGLHEYIRRWLFSENLCRLLFSRKLIVQCKECHQQLQHWWIDAMRFFLKTKNDLLS